MSTIDTFKHYLDRYQNKDLDAVAEMFADNILLRDWKISVQGKQAAVAETRKNFQNAETIDIEVLNCMSNETSVSGELKIIVDSTEVLYVVDVLTFDTYGQISSIRAYIGRED